MEYYMQKTYYKTASLISNSCKVIALLAGQTAEVAMLAYEYGKNLLVMWRPADKCELDAFPWYLEKFMIFPIHLSLELTFSVYFLSQGLAYQLIDDVLNFTGTSASFRKVALSDIRHGIVTAPLLCAMEEFPQLRAVIDQGLDNPANVDLMSIIQPKIDRIFKSVAFGFRAAIDSLPESDDKDVRKSRRALVNLTQRVITRTK
ncbi:solanesyl diphosphate synthase 3, chloroplastic/mitochondrial isoform X3 [Fagus crenata]